MHIAAATILFIHPPHIVEERRYERDAKKPQLASMRMTTQNEAHPVGVSIINEIRMMREQNGDCPGRNPFQSLRIVMHVDSLIVNRRVVVPCRLVMPAWVYLKLLVMKISVLYEDEG